VDKLLDSALRGSGIDPATADAQMAKRLAKDWMNPLVSPGQVQASLDRFVEHTLRDF